MESIKTANGATRMSSIQALNQWFSYIEQHCAKTTFISYRIIGLQLERYLPSDISDLKLEHLEQFLANIPAKTTNYNNHITMLRSFGRWLSDRNYPNPAQKLRYSKIPHKQQRTLTESEYRCVLAISGGDRWIIELLANTGLRAAEFLGIRSENIKGDFLYVNGKGSKIRAIPLNETAKKTLSHLNLVKNLKYHHLNLLCHRLSVKANIKDFCPHALRRYFATTLIERGVSIYLISKALGHSSVTITEKLYIRFSENQLKGITDVL